jgi:hypothetical protein
VKKQTDGMFAQFVLLEEVHEAAGRKKQVKIDSLSIIIIKQKGKIVKHGQMAARESMRATW